MTDACCYQQNRALSNLIAQKTKELDQDAFVHFLTTI